MGLHHSPSAESDQVNRPIAVFIEDDPQQTEIYSKILIQSGFDLLAFDAIAPALEHLRNSKDLIDLFILDRRLPVRKGEPASDELGDELLAEVRLTFPDARVIVFTGYATIPHIQEALQGSGQLPTKNGEIIDRITVLEKHDSLKFKRKVEEFRRLIQSLDDIEIAMQGISDGISYSDRRALRRLAFEYRAVSVTATPLGGGLTGASVWRCELSRPEGHVSTVVAKRVKKSPMRGGLPELLPRSSITSTAGTISGLMGGTHLNVLQTAGNNPQPLMDLIGSDPKKATEFAQPLWRLLNSISEQQRIVTVAEICAPLVDWGRLGDLLRPHNVLVPAGSETATVRIGVRHGDLHPGNVLIDNGQAVLIDFDSSDFAARLLDPITMLIATLVHPDSPICGSSWPSAKEISGTFGTEDFGLGHKQEVWFQAVTEWLMERKTSDRELWALTLAYAGRQLEFEDVTDDEAMVERIVAIAELASRRLNEL